MNPKKTLKLIGVTSVILQPNIGDSTETRLLMTHKTKDVGFKYDLNRYLDLVAWWRHLTLSEQYKFCLYYINDSRTVYDDAFDFMKSIEFGDTVHALFSLTNTYNGTRDQVIKKIKEFVNQMNAVHVPMVFNYFTVPELLATDKFIEWNINIDKHNKKLWRKSRNRFYHDYLMDLNDIASMKAIDVRDIHFINIANSENVLGITSYPITADIVQFCVNDVLCDTLFIPQSAITSPGPIIKCYTAALKLDNMLPSSTTYIQRVKILESISNINKLPVIINATSVSSFSVLSDCTLTIKIASMHTGELNLTLNSGVTHTISGHVLNLLISTMFIPSQLLLWFKQWKAQLLQTHATRNLLNELNEAYMLYDYKAGADLYNIWHNSVDVIIALAILPQYLTWILQMPDSYKPPIWLERLTNLLITSIVSEKELHNNV